MLFPKLMAGRDKNATFSALAVTLRVSVEF